MTLEEFNALSPDNASKQLLQCCHCAAWARDLAESRPYANVEALLERAVARWGASTEQEKLEAFSGHAQIGDLSALREKFSYANKEQGQITEADDQVLIRLQQKNQEYRDAFGFIFIICATGKSAAFMLSKLEQRLKNTRSQELANAANEQEKITEIRIKNWIHEHMQS